MSGEAGPVHLDSNAFIAAFETRGENADALRSLFSGAMRNVIRRVTSELTLAEVLAKPARLDDTELVDAYLTLIVSSGLIELHAVTGEILIETARYRADHDQIGAPAADRRNFLPDAVHVVTATRAGCSAFVSSDKRIPLPAGMRRVAPTAEGIGALLETS